MKILHVYKSYYPETTGGVERFLQSLCQTTHNLGVENILLTTTSKHRNAYQRTVHNTTVYYFPATCTLASCPISFGMVKAFNRICRTVDLVHYQFPWPFADCLHRQSAAPKPPSILTYHSDIVKQKWLKIAYQPIMHHFLQQVGCIVTTSENYLNSSPVLRKYKKKCQVIPIGIDRRHYPTPNANLLTQWRARIGQAFFLFVGVLRYYKGLHYLLAAVKNTDIHIVIAGMGSEYNSLRQYAQQHQLKHVHFVGYVSEVDKAVLYTLCRAVVVPSHLRSEAFCITLLEGLMFGKPLISTELNTGTSFVNAHNHSGLVVPPENPNALITALQRLQNDQALYQQLCYGAQKRYQQLFTAQKMAARYLELYQHVCQGECAS